VGTEVGDTFSIHLIPETRRLTTLGALRVGDRCNLELDAQTVAIVDTVERVLARRLG
jgi:riboflavin synthase